MACNSHYWASYAVCTPHSTQVDPTALNRSMTHLSSGTNCTRSFKGTRGTRGRGEGLHACRNDSLARTKVASSRRSEGWRGGAPRAPPTATMPESLSTTPYCAPHPCGSAHEVLKPHPEAYLPLYMNVKVDLS